MAYAKSTRKRTFADAGWAQQSKPAMARSPRRASKPKCTSVRVEKAQNGFSVSCSYDNGGSYDGPYHPGTTHVFADAASMAAFIKKTLGGGAK